jgi:hypothetical protein
MLSNFPNPITTAEFCAPFCFHFARCLLYRLRYQTIQANPNRKKLNAYRQIQIRAQKAKSPIAYRPTANKISPFRLRKNRA